MFFSGLHRRPHPLLTSDPNLAARLEVELGPAGRIHWLAPDHRAAARSLLDPSLLSVGRRQPRPPTRAEADMIIRNALARPSRQEGRFLPGGRVSPQVRSAGGPTPRSIDGISSARTHGAGIKSGVRLSGLDPAMEPVIGAVVQAARNLGLPQPVITAGRDGRHRPASLHYRGRALDFRGNNISVTDGRRLAAEVRNLLGPGYDVGYEVWADPRNNHVHVEYDPG